MNPIKMLEVIEFYNGIIDPEDQYLETVKRMLPQMTGFAESAIYLAEPQKSENWDKANRWLGFVQGIFYSKGIFTIDEMREHNRT